MTDIPPIDPTLIRPTVEEVSILERTRTVGLTSGGLGGDTSVSDVTVFGTETRPSAAEVDLIIDQALQAITAQLPPAIPALYYAQTRHNVALYAAILIEGSFFRESLDEGSVELYRDLLRSGMLALQDAIGDTSAAAGRVDSVMVRGVMAEGTYLDPLPLVIP
jgi:hypothetical protein